MNLWETIIRCLMSPGRIRTNAGKKRLPVKFVYKNSKSMNEMHEFYDETLAFAKRYPRMVDKALLLVTSGIAHGPVMPMIGKE